MKPAFGTEPKFTLLAVIREDRRHASSGSPCATCDVRGMRDPSFGGNNPSITDSLAPSLWSLNFYCGSPSAHLETALRDSSVDNGPNQVEGRRP